MITIKHGSGKLVLREEDVISYTTEVERFSDDTHNKTRVVISRKGGGPLMATFYNEGMLAEALDILDDSVAWGS